MGMDEALMVYQFISRIHPYEYVSFDLFDTLIFRTFREPMDVFDAVEYLYNVEHKNKITKFRQLRHEAELIARRKITEHEISIHDIYNCLDLKDKEQLKQYEREIEVENCVPNHVMCEFLRQVQDLGKRVLITTDMYLDKDTIEKILNKIGVKNYTLFLSSEVGVTKVSGKLFPHILAQIGIDGSRIVHFGDNPVSDIDQAKAAGIAAYERLVSNDAYALSDYKPNIKGIVANHIQSFCRFTIQNNTPECRIGYTVLGPVIAEFCKWLNGQYLRHNADQILFVAREGYLLKEAYLRLYPEQVAKVGYLNLNKNLLRQPSLYLNPTPEQLLDTLPMRDTYTLKELMAALLISQEQLSSIKGARNLPESLRKQDILNGKYDVFFTALFTELKDVFQQQYECLLDYLASWNIPESKVLLVNNSINGNGQRMLENFMSRVGLRADIYGIQFVRSRRCRKVLGERSIGWITDSSAPAYYTMQFNRYALMLEHLLFESKGTAKIFKENKDGSPQVVCGTQGAEENNNSGIEAIQQATLDYVSRYKTCVPVFMGSEIIRLFVQLYRYPGREDAELLGGLYDVDGDGETMLLQVMNWKQGNMVLGGKKKSFLMALNAVELLQDVIKVALSKCRERFGKSLNM